MSTLSFEINSIKIIFRMSMVNIEITKNDSKENITKSDVLMQIFENTDILISCTKIFISISWIEQLFMHNHSITRHVNLNRHFIVSSTNKPYLKVNIKELW